MAYRKSSPEQILSHAIALRADAYRRWSREADAAVAADTRRAYRELAALECDRYEQLLQRFVAGQQTPRKPSLSLPPRASRGAPLRAAAVQAEAERRTWTAQLRRTGLGAPHSGLLTALIEEARLVRQLVAAPRRSLA